MLFLHRLLFVGFVLASALLPFTASAQSLDDLADRTVVLRTAAPETAGKATVTTAVSTSQTGTYTGVVLHGLSHGEKLQGWVRFADRAAGTDWQPLYITRSATDGFFAAAYRGDTVRMGTAFELRFLHEGAEAVRLLEAGVFDARVEEPLLPYAGSSMQPTPSGVVAPPRVTRRSEWGARPFQHGQPSPLARPTYIYLTLHHAAGFGAETYGQGVEQVRAIQTFHQDGRGWSDIGYHFVMNESGDFYQGRPFMNENADFADGPPLVLGAHAGGANTGNIGICALGCYHPPEGSHCEDRLSSAAFDSLATMMAFLADAYDVPAENIRGHRDFGSTACPGNENYELLDELREQVARLLSGEETLVDPGRFVLDPAYPNPLTAGTASIRYFLDQGGAVRLRVYDSLGREVRTLVDGFQEGEAWYTVAIDRAGLASGTYYYRLTVEGFSSTIFDETRALVILR